MNARHCLLAVFVVATAAVCTASDHTKDSLDKVKQGVAEKKAVIVDVREQSEWNAGHLAEAKFVPLSKLSAEYKSPAFIEQLAKDLPKDKIIYCHCKAGARALGAADLFEELGYDVRPLKEGYSALIEAGFPKAK